MSLAVTVLKNSAVLLLFLLFISCGTKNKEYAMYFLIPNFHKKKN
jgi:hypothetical protein